MKKKWRSAAAAAVLSICALAAPISVPNTVTPVAVQAASSGTTLADMPSTYQSAAEWILQNRIISEGSVKDWATIYDQIVAGNGTLKYVVKWQSKQTITLEQRKQLQTVLETAVNDWTDWLVGYENWPYTHVNVQIVGWAVLDQNCLLDLQPDETVYTTTIPADTSYITDGNMAVSELPTLEPIGDETRYRYIHWADQSYQYPDGYENRYDMYLQATQGMIDMGGFGYHWGQQLSDNAVLGLIAGTSSMHILEHEMGHSFGLTDFYGGEGESDGFPPGGFPDGGTSIMMAGSSQTITNFDGWFFRYLWSYLAKEDGRFNLTVPSTTTTATTSETTTETTETTTTTVTTTVSETQPAYETVSFTDTISEIVPNTSVTFAEYGTFFFQGDSYYHGDESKNLSHYEAGDKISIQLTYDRESGMIQRVDALQLEENSHKVIGDVNADGQFTIADVVMVQKWLLGSGNVTDLTAGDYNADGQLNGLDLCSMKQALRKETQEA